MNNIFLRMAATKENALRPAPDYKGVVARSGHPGSKRGFCHRHNPAGTKLIRRVLKTQGRQWKGETR